MATPTVPAVEVVGLVKKFGPLTAVDGLDLRIEPGECFGLLGPNGAGKTTTVEILEGLQTRDGGVVRVLGRTWEQDADELRERLGVQLQESQLYEKLSVKETLELFASFYRNALPVEVALQSVGLVDKADAWLGKLSGGQRQRLAVATTLVADPELCFFDEPTTGLDPTSRRALWEVLTQIRARGRTLVLTTHYMDEAERLCDRVAIVNRGKVIALGTPSQLIASVGGHDIIEVTTRPGLDEASVKGLPGLVRARTTGNELRLTVEELHVALPPLLDLARQKGAAVENLITRHATLEDVFLNLTGSNLADDAPREAA